MADKVVKELFFLSVIYSDYKNGGNPSDKYLVRSCSYYKASLVEGVRIFEKVFFKRKNEIQATFNYYNSAY